MTGDAVRDWSRVRSGESLQSVSGGGHASTPLRRFRSVEARMADDPLVADVLEAGRRPTAGERDHFILKYLCSEDMVLLHTGDDVRLVWTVLPSFRVLGVSETRVAGMAMEGLIKRNGRGTPGFYRITGKGRKRSGSCCDVLLRLYYRGQLEAHHIQNGLSIRHKHKKAVLEHETASELVARVVIANMPIEQAERELSLPIRSGKEILRMALDEVA